MPLCPRRLRVFLSATIALWSTLLAFGQEIQITTHPQSYRVGVPGGAILSVVARGSGLSTPFRYQWFKDGEPIENATRSTLTVTNSMPAVEAYKIRLIADGIEKDSNEAIITYTRPGPAGLLAHYDFETDSDTAIMDSTGRFPGISSNVTHVAGVIGQKALAFNGTNSSVRMPFPDSQLDLAGHPIP